MHLEPEAEGIGPDSSEAGARLLAHLEDIDSIAAAIARRHALRREEAEEFTSAVHLKLTQDDCAVLRKFEQRAALRTYLTAVITNVFRDYRNQRWGRWRNSVAARRRGPLAMRLETLLYRDSYTLAQAAEILRGTELNVPGDADLARLAAILPERPGTYEVGDSALGGAVAPQASDDGLWLTEAERVQSATEHAVARALAALPHEDQLIVRMQYFDNMTVADIARTLHLDQKPLYRRCEAIRRQVRRELEAQGLGADVVARYFGDEGMA